MTYSRSNARDAALTRVRELRLSFTYVKVRPRQVPTIIKDAVFQNCVFQLSALFEDYLYELTSQWLGNLSTNSAPNSAIPLLTRALFVARAQEEAFKRFLTFSDEQDLAERTGELLAVFGLFDESAAIPALDFRNKLIKDRKFPSVRNVEAVFRRLGAAKIFQALSRRTRTDVEIGLQAFMDVRNALAHESPPSITDVDVDRYFSQIESWVEAVDREFYGHVVRSSGSQFWG